MNAGIKAPIGEQKCPVCSKILIEDEYRAALVTLQENNPKVYANLLRVERKKFENNLARIKKDHKARLEAMKKSQTIQNRNLRKKLRDAKLKDRKRFNQELLLIKRRYQVQAENLRDFYSNQGKLNQTKQGLLEESKLDAIISQQEALSNNIITRLDEIRDVLVNGSHAKSLKPQPANSGLLGDDSKVIETTNEAGKVEKLKEIAEMIKQISAEHKRGNNVYQDTNTL